MSSVKESRFRGGASCVISLKDYFFLLKLRAMMNREQNVLIKQIEKSTDFKQEMPFKTI